MLPQRDNSPNDFWTQQARGPIVEHLARYQRHKHCKRIAIEKALHGFLLGDHRDELSGRLRSVYPETADDFNKSGTTADGYQGAPVGHRQFELVRMYSDRLAVVFHEMPDLYLVDSNGERLPDTDPQQQQWSEDLKTIGGKLGAHTMLQTAERWTWGMRQPFVSPRWVHGSLRWHIFAPYQCRIDPDPVCPAELERAPLISVVIPQQHDDVLDHPDELYETWQLTESGQWLVWIHDEGGNLYQNPIFADNVNAYKRHPFVVWRIEQPEDGEFWLPANDAWYQQQLSADVKLSDLDHHLKTQIHSQMFIRGAGDQRGKFTFGPDVALHTEDGEAELDYITPEPNLEMLVDAFNFTLKTGAVAEGLPPDTWEPNSSTRNLAAKKLEREALLHRRRQVVPWLVGALQQTFEIHKAVANVRGGRTRYRDDVYLAVELVPLPEINDRAQESQALQADLDMGLISKVDILRQRYGLTREEAVRRLQRISNDNARFGVPTDVTQVTVGTQRPPDVRADA